MTTDQQVTGPTRTFTPDREWVDDEGHRHRTIKLKRACNGCSTLIGDVTDQEIERAIAGLPAEDVRSECSNCAPLVHLEKDGCQTWQVTERSVSDIFTEFRQAGVFIKAIKRYPTGSNQLAYVGVRVGDDFHKVYAMWGDWLIRHPDGSFTVHAAPKGGEAA